MGSTLIYHFTANLPAESIVYSPAFHLIPNIWCMPWSMGPSSDTVFYGSSCQLNSNITVWGRRSGLKYYCHYSQQGAWNGRKACWILSLLKDESLIATMFIFRNVLVDGFQFTLPVLLNKSPRQATSDAGSIFCRLFGCRSFGWASETMSHSLFFRTGFTIIYLSSCNIARVKWWAHLCSGVRNDVDYPSVDPLSHHSLILYLLLSLTQISHTFRNFRCRGQNAQEDYWCAFWTQITTHSG